ncbi:MAG: 4Fe-4S cluster-binding domain-containing protein [Verrucomicrobia bacterium]|nr:4Fe-4S cluster-binding domain-containing protein [Verrucomicrobiota bacterium]
MNRGVDNGRNGVVECWSADTCITPTLYHSNTPPPPTSRAVSASERANLARKHFTKCHLCHHHCGANRSSGDRGPCRTGTDARIFSAQIEVSDELELIPTFAIAFSGCDLRCAFCITGKESWNPNAGELFNATALAERATAALEDGARSIMILGGEPTIHLPHVLELVALLPDSAKLIWKTNAHGSVGARELLDGLFDIWLADYKFGDDRCAERLALVTNYTEVVRDNLLWANQHSELIVRHLVMPGHVECCWRPIANWIAENLPTTKVNLRSGFWPAWQSRKHSELRTPVADTESKLAFQIAHEYGLNLIQ